MKERHKERLIGIASIAAGAAFFATSWLSILPTKQFRAYWQEIELRRTLRQIRPPAGAKVVSITGVSRYPFLFVNGTYVADSNFDTVKEHYLREFPRHGFAYTGESREADGHMSMNFCAPGYEATLDQIVLSVPTGSRLPFGSMYEILLIKMEGSKC